MDNHLYKYDKLKLIITCRESALASTSSSHHQFFSALNPQLNMTLKQQYIYLMPFDNNHIDHYIEQFVTQNQQQLQIEIAQNRLLSPWIQLKTYQQAIKSISGIRQLM